MSATATSAVPVGQRRVGEGASRWASRFRQP